jgi:hypothetical protein
MAVHTCNPIWEAEIERIEAVIEYLLCKSEALNSNPSPIETIDVALFGLSVCLYINFSRLCLSRTWSISTRLPRCEHRVALVFLDYTLKLMGSIAASPLSLLIVVICILFLSFFSLAKGFTMIFSKN